MVRTILALLVAVICLASRAASDRQDTKKISVLMICFPASGHIAVPMALGEELAKRGHNVTLFTVQPKDHDRSKKSAERAGIAYVSVDINANYEMFEQLLEEARSGTTLTGWLQNMYGTAAKLLRMVDNVTRTTLSALDTPSLRKYDLLVATEVTSPLAMCLSKKWGVPLVIVSTVPEFFLHSKPFWPFPGVGPLQQSDDVDFLGRLFDTVEKHVTSSFLPFGTKVTSLAMDCPVTASEAANGPGVSIPNIIPTVIGFEYPHPVSPLTTYTGPILISSDEPLAEEALKWLDARPEGSVVYIHIASNFYLKKAAAWAIVEGLYATGYNAVWNMQEKSRYILDGLVINEKIMLVEDVPQLTVMRHRSVKMAILHSGINDIHEAVYCGLPVIVLPMVTGSGDQWGNAARVVGRGLGVMLNPANLSGTQVAESIRLIEMGKYQGNVNKLQKIFRHAGGVVKAADLVEFYAEVGYDHLIPAFVKYNWSWIQYYNVDVYALLVLMGLSTVWITYAMCKWTCRVCCQRKKAKPKRD